MDEDDQRVRNFLLYKVWATDAERDELFGSPVFRGILIVGLILIVLLVVFH